MAPILGSEIARKFYAADGAGASGGQRRQALRRFYRIYGVGGAYVVVYYTLYVRRECDID